MRRCTWPMLLAAILFFSVSSSAQNKKEHGSAPSGKEPKEMARQLTTEELQRDHISGVQRTLNELGYDAGPEDGVLGPRTKAAICAYHRVSNLKGNCNRHFADGKMSAYLRLSLSLAAREGEQEEAGSEASVPRYGYLYQGYVTGNSFRDLSKGQQRAYVVGVIDGMFTAAAGPPIGPEGSPAQPYNLANKVKRFVSCIKGMPGRQVTAIVNQHLSEHPGEWHHPMNALVWSAMHKICAP